MATEQVAEVVADHIEEVAEQIDEAAEVTRRLTGREINFAILGLGIGLVAGHYISKPYWKKKYEELANTEISEMREHYHQKIAVLEQKPKLEEIVREQGYTQTEEEAINDANRRFPAEEEISEEESKGINVVSENAGPVSNIFTTTGEVVDRWNYDKELAQRTEDRPYVIHIEEFKEAAKDYDQVTYTWWENDSIMTAADDEVVEEVDRIVGEENLKLFGHGSEQQHVVYVRNDKLGMDIEILRSQDGYGEVVHGLDLRHSEPMRRRRRFDDD